MQFSGSSPTKSPAELQTNPHPSAAGSSLLSRGGRSLPATAGLSPSTSQKAPAEFNPGKLVPDSTTGLKN